MTESSYKALQRAHPHSTECRFTEPCHFRVKWRGSARCNCLSDCGFRPEYDDCPFRLTEAQYEQNTQDFPFNRKYAEEQQ